MHPFVRAVADFAHRQSLFPPNARILVALSGGPDSCALLLALVEAAEQGLLPRPCAAAHFHHGLRGQDADADAALAGALCARWGIPCVIGLGAVPDERAVPGNRRSPNDAARRARYAFLDEAAGDVSADIVATAHTAGDQAETVLLRILRGTGPDGLAGIPLRRPLRPGLTVVRPLLALTRHDVETYCRDRDVSPRRDPSNENRGYPRARLRSLLPGLAREFNPRLPEALRRLAAAAAADADLLGEMTDTLWACVATLSPRRACLDPSLRAAHPALRRRVLLRALQHAAGEKAAMENAASSANVEVLEALLLAPKGAADLDGGVQARGDGSGLVVESPVIWQPPDPFCLPLSVPGRIWVRPAALSLRASWTGARGDSGPFSHSRRSRIALLAYGTMEAEPNLWVRSARPGDRIAPLGMGGATRPVRDLMADAGWPASVRLSAPLVVCPTTGAVLWIVGLAQAEYTRIGSKANSVLRLVAEPDC